MRKPIRIIGGVLLSLIVVGIGLSAVYWQEIQRFRATITLFDEDNIVHNFSHLNSHFENSAFKRSGAVYNFGLAPHPLPDSFEFNGASVSVQEFLQRRQTTALLVIKDNEITFENYYLGTGEDDLRASWSVGKSFVSALLGIAVGEGLIDINKPITAYLPELKGSGYAQTTIKNVLQMSSGVAWNEDYDDFNSDINRMGRIMALGGSLDQFAASLVNEKKPGTQWHYVSMDTQVLGMLIRRVTGKPLVRYIEQKIWSKIGAEADGYWLTDSAGAEFALGGINLRTRDYARFGRLFLNHGKLEGEQLISTAWVKDSITPDSPHITPSPEIMGYGYQWWLGRNPRPGEFSAIGVYGQYLYINQPENLIIVKNSADRLFTLKPNSMHETFAFFRAVADSFQGD